MDADERGAALCAPFLARLPVVGVSISVVSSGGAQSTVGTTSPTAARLEELQFRLGEGPTQDTARTGRPVLVPDLSVEAAHQLWPLFAPAAQDAGATAVFTFPLAIAGTTVGVVSLHGRGAPAPWSDLTVQAAEQLAHSAALPAIELAMGSAAGEPEPGKQRTELRREVHQAAGMVMVQLDCMIADAMARLRAHAFVTGEPIDVVARAIVTRTLHFDRAD